MEHFKETVEIFRKALNIALRERKGEGELVFNFNRHKSKFNIWSFRYDLFWVPAPNVVIPVYTLVENIPVSSDQLDKIEVEMFTKFIGALFARQNEIWSLISTNQD